MSGNSIIPNNFLKLQLFIHKGKFFKKLYITNQMIGNKFGAYGLTRKPFYYPIKESKKKKNNFYGTFKFTDFKSYWIIFKMI